MQQMFFKMKPVFFAVKHTTKQTNKCNQHKEKTTELFRVEVYTIYTLPTQDKHVYVQLKSLIFHYCFISRYKNKVSICKMQFKGVPAQSFKNIK